MAPGGSRLRLFLGGLLGAAIRMWPARPPSGPGPLASAHGSGASVSRAWRWSSGGAIRFTTSAGTTATRPPSGRTCRTCGSLTCSGSTGSTCPTGATHLLHQNQLVHFFVVVNTQIYEWGRYRGRRPASGCAGRRSTPGRIVIVVIASSVRIISVVVRVRVSAAVRSVSALKVVVGSAVRHPGSRSSAAVDGRAAATKRRHYGRCLSTLRNAIS